MNHDTKTFIHIKPMFQVKFLWLCVYRFPGISSIFLDERSHKQMPEISDLLFL